ncbi:MAG TPA: MFS transporter [Gemmatimonadaceae bacterium]
METTMNPQESTESPISVGHRQILIAFSGLVLAMLLAALDSTIVSTALPTIVSELGGLEHLAWVVTAYLLAQTIVTPIYGKLGDLYGRKSIMQSAIVLFLIGSALCGLSQNMTELILFRAIQGLGGGGLVVTTQAVVGDIVPPRDRGRYQGIFGAVYGLASIAGPLLGGYFTTHWSWRWIFYINLPLGLAALIVLAATLPSASRRISHAVDYLGAGLLAVTLSSITLLSDLGGTAYPWSSPMSIGLIAIAVLSLVVFVIAERKAKEPVLPMRLFRQQTFVITSAVGLIVGFALFGSVTYFPLYLQVVKGVSPTASGMQMIPMMVGMLVTSIASGQLISRSGRYKIFPILGTVIMSAGLFLLSRLTPQSTSIMAASLLLVLGVGLGLVMQVLVIAVQNAVEYRDLGVATSGATLFRLVGGSLGTAILGAVFSSRLTANLSQLGAGPGAGSAQNLSMQAMARLPAATRAIYASAFTASLDTVFFVATVVCAVGFVLTWLLPERPLRATVAAGARDIGNEAGEAFARPQGERAVAAHLYAALSSMADRDVQRAHIERIVARAGETLTPLAAWLLVQVERNSETSPFDLARSRGIAPERAQAALEELRRRGLVTVPKPNSTHSSLTPNGCQVLDRIVDARRAHLAELAEEWDPTHEDDAVSYLRTAVRDLVPDVKRVT